MSREARSQDFEDDVVLSTGGDAQVTTRRSPRNTGGGVSECGSRSHHVAELLDKMAQASEGLGRTGSRSFCYRKAATSVRNLERDVEALGAGAVRRRIKYIGNAIAKRIDEYLRTGKLEALEKMENSSNPHGRPRAMKRPLHRAEDGFQAGPELPREERRRPPDLASGSLTEAVGQVMAKKLAEEVAKMKEGSSRMLPGRGVQPGGDAGRLLR